MKLRCWKNWSFGVLAGLSCTYYTRTSRARFAFTYTSKYASRAEHARFYTKSMTAKQTEINYERRLPLLEHGAARRLTRGKDELFLPLRALGKNEDERPTNLVLAKSRSARADTTAFTITVLRGLSKHKTKGLSDRELRSVFGLEDVSVGAPGLLEPSFELLRMLSRLFLGSCPSSSIKGVVAAANTLLQFKGRRIQFRVGGLCRS